MVYTFNVYVALMSKSTFNPFTVHGLSFLFVGLCILPHFKIKIWKKNRLWHGNHADPIDCLEK